MHVHDVLSFWFGGADLRHAPAPDVPRRWFAGGPSFDAEIARRFGPLLDAPAARDDPGRRREAGPYPSPPPASSAAFRAFARSAADSPASTTVPTTVVVARTIV